MYVYRKTNGRAHDLRLVDDDYQPADGEITGEGHDLPPIDTLHDPVDPKVAHNAGIDAQIRVIEGIYRMTERAQREGHYGTALLADALNVIVGQIEEALRTIPGQEGLALARLPDLKQNAGMKKIKAAEDLIKPLRQQRLP